MPPAGGPPNIKEISIDDLARLGIDSENQLYWDGRRIEIRRRLDLTGAQKMAAVLVTLFAVLGGFGGFASGIAEGSAFLCARHITWLSCPLSP